MNKNNKILFNMIASIGIKGAGLVLSLFLMPAYFQYFQEQKILGLWFTILSFLTWILTFDFGIGNGLRNKLTIAISMKKTDKVKQLISTTYFISIIIALFMFILFLCFTNFINWNNFFNISNDIISSDTLKRAMNITLIGVILQFVLKVINSILLAIQMPSISNSLALLSNIIIFVFVVTISDYGDEKNLILLAIIHAIASNIPLIIATITIFATILKESRPSINYINKSDIRNIFILGIGFFTLQLLSLALFNMKEFLITWTTSPEFVVEFQVYHRIFHLVVSLAWIALIPMWSAITEAYAVRDFSWMKKTYYNLKKLMIVACLGLVVLVFTFQYVVDIWLGDNAVTVNLNYTLAFAVFSALYIWWGVIASFANGTGKIRTQLILSAVGVFLNFILSILFVNLTNDWIWIIYANIISMLPYCIIEPINIRKMINSK